MVSFKQKIAESILWIAFNYYSVSRLAAVAAVATAVETAYIFYRLNKTRCCIVYCIKNCTNQLIYFSDKSLHFSDDGNRQ